MADVWFAKDGGGATQGATPRYTLPLDDCITKLDLTQAQFLSDLSTVPKFGEPDDPLADIRGNQHVMIMVKEDEAKGRGWRPGYYRSPVSPHEAFSRLGPPRQPGN